MIKVRASQVLIEMPKENAEPWLHITVQRIQRDGNIVNTQDRWDTFSHRLSDIAMMPTVNLIGEGNIVVGQVAQQLTASILGILVARYGGEITADGELIIEV